MTTPVPLSGKSLIGADPLPDSDDLFHAVDPRTGTDLEPSFAEATLEQIDRACTLAAQASESYARLAPTLRARFLRSIADNIDDGADAIVARTEAETGLPAARLVAELAGTTKQVRMFADLVERGEWRRITLVTDGSGPDMRTHKIPVGPVAVFGASNFPLSYSVAGGDTASALAAGSPVVFKAHPSHPGASELVGAAIRTAVHDNELHEGVFSLLLGAGTALGEQLVTHPQIKSVAFTGSQGGGMALVRLGAGRPEPIPVFAEMTSVNPHIVFPHARGSRGAQIAIGFATHLTARVGQMCLAPGMILVTEGEGFRELREALVGSLASTPPQTMLNERTYGAYRTRIDQVTGAEGVRVAAQGPTGDGWSADAVLFETTGDELLAQPALATEIFGPAAILVRCSDVEQMRRIVETLDGQLTGVLHVDAEDLPLARPFVPTLERKVGRIIVNSYSNEVVVGDASVHGGPFPATSDSRFTSVGTLAIERFLRPVAYQAVPEDLLPEPLLDANPFHTVRLVNGVVRLP